MPIFKITITRSSPNNSYSSVTIYKDKNNAKQAHETGVDLMLDIWGEVCDPNKNSIRVEEDHP